MHSRIHSAHLLLISQPISLLLICPPAHAHPQYLDDQEAKRQAHVQSRIDKLKAAFEQGGGIEVRCCCSRLHMVSLAQWHISCVSAGELAFPGIPPCLLLLP